MRFIAEFMASTAFNSIMFAWTIFFAAFDLLIGQYVLAGIMAVLALYWGNRVFNPPYAPDPYDE